LQRFCSSGCRDANRRWEVWVAGQVYRATEQGKVRRREQRNRARMRAKERCLQHEEDVPDTSILPEITSTALPQAGSADCSVCVLNDSGIVPTDAAMATSSELRVGHHKHGFSKKSCCFRPGCYVRFCVTGCSPQQIFCSPVCRNALRRVRQREEYWLRRLGMRCRHRGPPVDDID
jgi:hypothetical protein